MEIVTLMNPKAPSLTARVDAGQVAIWLEAGWVRKEASSREGGEETLPEVPAKKTRKVKGGNHA